MKGWRLVKVGYASWKAGDTLPGYQVTLPLKTALISLLVSNSECIYHHSDDDGCPLDPKGFTDCLCRRILR